MGPPLGRQGQSVNDEERPSTDDSPDFDSTDSPSRPATRRRRYEERVYRRNVSTVDEVMGEATGYVSAFFADRMDRDGYRVPEEMWEASRNANRYITFLLRAMCISVHNVLQCFPTCGDLTSSRENCKPPSSITKNDDENIYVLDNILKSNNPSLY